jgi:hypothetical protein
VRALRSGPVPTAAGKSKPRQRAGEVPRRTRGHARHEDDSIYYIQSVPLALRPLHATMVRSVHVGHSTQGQRSTSEFSVAYKSSPSRRAYRSTKRVVSEFSMPLERQPLPVGNPAHVFFSTPASPPHRVPPSEPGWTREPSAHTLMVSRQKDEASAVRHQRRSHESLLGPDT